jgi:hypothetical protein
MESRIRDKEPRKKAHILPTGTACCVSGDCGMDEVFTGRLAEGVEIMIMVGHSLLDQ